MWVLFTPPLTERTQALKLRNHPSLCRTCHGSGSPRRLRAMLKSWNPESALSLKMPITSVQKKPASPPEASAQSPLRPYPRSRCNSCRRRQADWRDHRNRLILARASNRSGFHPVHVAHKPDILLSVGRQLRIVLRTCITPASFADIPSAQPSSAWIPSTIRLFTHPEQRVFDHMHRRRVS